MEPTRGSAKLGEYLRRLRRGYGFSLRRVEERAREAGGEIDNSQLSRYEKGRCYPSFDKLRILAQIFNVPIQSFSDVIDLERFQSLKPGSRDFPALRDEGNQEMARGNFGRAYMVFETCMEILEAGGRERFGEELDELRALCHYNMARALLRLGKVNLSESELRRMLRGSHRLSDRTKRMALILLSNVHREQGDRFLAIVDGEKCLAMAREAGDAEIVSAAHHAVGSAWYEEGEHARALESLLQAWEGYRSLGQAEKALTLLADIGVCEVAIGKPKRGLQRIREAVHGARLGSHRRALGYGFAKEGLAHVLLKEASAARTCFQEAEAIAGRGEDRYVDILFLCAFYQWRLAREDRNPVQEKITFGRLKHLRPALERRFLEVQGFDEFIQGAEEARTP